MTQKEICARRKALEKEYQLLGKQMVAIEMKIDVLRAECSHPRMKKEGPARDPHTLSCPDCGWFEQRHWPGNSDCPG